MNVILAFTIPLATLYGVCRLLSWLNPYPGKGK